jgi:hypothetical protein
MQSKRIDLDAGRLSSRSFVDYDQVCRRLIEQFGATHNVLTLGPADFEKLYAHLCRKHKVNTLGREITSTWGVFKYAYESALIGQPIRFGPKFRVPSKQSLRKPRPKQSRRTAKNSSPRRRFGHCSMRRRRNSGP